MADFSFITERLACGGQINDAADMLSLTAAGITHIIDAQGERNDGPLITAYVGGYLWDGTADDGQAKSVGWFRPAIVFAISALTYPGNVVMTHCAAGVNRGPSLAYAIMRALGWGANDAIVQLKSKRPIVIVRYVPDAEAALKTLGWTR